MPPRQELTRSVNELSPTEWFIEQMVVDLDLRDTASAKRARRLLVRLVTWATGEGIALDRELILDPDTVERFVEIALARDSSASTYRSILRSLGPQLTKRAPWEPKPISIPRRGMALPYTDAELRLLVRDAKDQTTSRRRQAARAFLALGLGAGLDGRWISKVRPSDVEKFSCGVRVRVGDPSARVVVVRHQYERDVLDLVDNIQGDFLVGGRSTSANRTGNLVASFVVPIGHPCLAPSRLRSTWLVAHLACGTRLPELCAAAGLESPAWLGVLFPFVAPLSDEHAASMLRGPFE